MTLPPETRERALGQIIRFCEERIRPDMREAVRLEHEARRDSITIVERRPPWREDLGPEWTRSPIAWVGYAAKTAAWSLYWRDSREHWLAYDDCAPTNDVAPLLAEIAADPYGCFWG